MDKKPKGSDPSSVRVEILKSDPVSAPKGTTIRTEEAIGKCMVLGLTCVFVGFDKK